MLHTSSIAKHIGLYYWVTLMSKESKDFILASILILLSSIVLVVIIPREIKIPNYSAGVSPRQLPTISCWIVIIMSIILAVTSYIKDNNCVKESFNNIVKLLSNPNYLQTVRNVVTVLSLSVIYYIGFNSIGFIITTIVVLPLLSIIFGYRKYLNLIIISVITISVLYFSFAYFMHIYLPGWAPFI